MPVDDLLQLPVDIEPQPDGMTCVPTCLHALYRFHGLDVALPSVEWGAPSMDRV